MTTTIPPPEPKPLAFLTTIVWIVSVLLILVAVYLNSQAVLSIIVVFLEITVLKAANFKTARSRNLFNLLCLVIIGGMLVYTISDYTRIKHQILNELKRDFDDQNKAFLKKSGQDLESVDSSTAVRTLHDFHMKLRDSLCEEKDLKRLFRKNYEDKFDEWSQKEIREFMGKRRKVVPLTAFNYPDLVSAINNIIDHKEGKNIDPLCNAYGINDNTMVYRVFEDPTIASAELGSFKKLMNGIMEGFDSHIRFKKITKIIKNNNEISSIEFINGQ